ncbi:hypothetical protein N7499_004107 [Penicillium canescens]|uniref:uncharacterized protein n=1 Tax=Penicillium canescens TaxID=5083 RepID=UPI0026E0C612|nr:uncharacterized protein N7446_012192 [Penicillium canescens]KAJ6045328.1 hypothetical protein N7446_012192 [Penicillium canescens]KAJ6061028.1 hypothetical protein N7444_001724 [Penicillium canescens]KAJ6088856.1 hypothetical protein N7499_004107 [Penicillium canescens]
MSLIDSSSLNPGKHDILPLVNSGSLEGFIKYMGILASSSESQFASAVIGEITQQREQIHSQDEELKKLQKEILYIQETKRTTINDMLTANETERAKQTDSATQIESLHATVDEKESKIAEYSKDLEGLQQEVANLKSTCSLEIAKVSQSAEDISTLQANLKEKDKMIDQMKTARSKLKSMLSSQQKKNEDLETANASMSTELQAVRARIQKLEDFPVQSSDIDDDFVKVDNIILPPSFPLIPSNSSAAKAVRFALILAVLFREINQRIFQPSYFISEGNNLREALEHLAESNGEREAFCRRILLSIDPCAEHDILKAEIRAVVQRMSSYAGSLFPEAQHDLFCTKVKTIVQNAAEVWLPIQRSQKKFETDFEPFDPEDNEWDRFPSAGKTTTPVAQDLQGLYLLNVFPCISLVEDGDHDPLTKIIQLRSSQELYLAAQHEATQTSTSANTRRYSTRPRRQSTAGSNGKPFLGGNLTNG